MNTEDIKGVINKKALQDFIDDNEDPYASCCVKLAIKIMKHLDNFEGELNIGYYPDITTPHAIITKCDNQGVTGFMAGFAVSIVSICHKLGWKFYLAYLISDRNIENAEFIEEKIKNISKNNKLVDQDVARQYVKDLIHRRRENLTLKSK